MGRADGGRDARSRLGRLPQEEPAAATTRPYISAEAAICVVRDARPFAAAQCGRRLVHVCPVPCQTAAAVTAKMDRSYRPARGDEYARKSSRQARREVERIPSTFSLVGAANDAAGEGLRSAPRLGGCITRNQRLSKTANLERAVIRQELLLSRP